MLLPHPRQLVLRPGPPVPVDTPVERKISPITHAAQGYRISIANGEIIIRTADAAGLYYAEKTLAQLRRMHPRGIPAMEIEDWPDFPVRGFMLDISRDKIPTMASLFELVDQLAELKINQLQLYTEHTFAYGAHEIVWKDASPMTANEIRELDAYCRNRFIELVPNQNSFGHLERWFKHPQYEYLAEKPDGFVFPNGLRMPTGFSLNPTDSRSIVFVERLFDELLPNFSSNLFNVGCDETLDLGLGRSKAEVESRGRERVYLDFLLTIHDAVKRRGKVMLFWGDIILHQPELIGELPKDLIALNWGYEANHPFEKETQAFRDASVPFYVCPGTSSWCSLGGRTKNAIANLQSAAEQGKRNGAQGYLITDWGDYGHLQYWPVSLLGLVAGASYAWCLESNRALDLPGALEEDLFRDEAKQMGKVLFDLGEVASALPELTNGTRLFWALIGGPEHRARFENVSLEQYSNIERILDELNDRLGAARMQCRDGALIQSELRNTIRMMRYACARGRVLNHGQPNQGERLLAEVSEEHRRLWLARNRAGGLESSLARLNGPT